MRLLIATTILLTTCSSAYSEEILQTFICEGTSTYQVYTDGSGGKKKATGLTDNSEMKFFTLDFLGLKKNDKLIVNFQNATGLRAGNITLKKYPLLLYLTHSYSGGDYSYTASSVSLNHPMLGQISSVFQIHLTPDGLIFWSVDGSSIQFVTAKCVRK